MMMVMEQSATAIPSSFTSWLTPTVLFLLLNLTIAAIALISSLASSSSPDTHHNLIRSPSILHRLKSIRFPHQQDHNLKSHEFDPQEQHHNLKSDEFDHQEQDHNLKNPQSDELDHQIHQEEEDDNQGETMDEIYSRLKGFTPSKSETEPAVRVKKSVSFRSASVMDFETVVAIEARRPATVRERVRARMTDGDAEVDSKADDFINKFKQQLKLQRLDSIKDRVWGKARA